MLRLLLVLMLVLFSTSAVFFPRLVVLSLAFVCGEIGRVAMQR